MDKKTIMKMNDTWKDFRVNERAILFKPGFAHGFVGLKKENIISYHCTNYRSKKHEIGLNQ